MAIIKAVSSKASIGTAIEYVSKEEKTEAKLMSGLNCSADTCLAEMQATKELWNKTGGRTYKHFTHSYHANENITLEQAHQNAVELAKNTEAFKGFEVLIATHKDRDHIHSHFIVNSVSFEDGHKLQWSKADLSDLKNRCNQQSREQGLHVPEKGKTFEGQDREELVAWTKESFQQLQKSEVGEAESWVRDCAFAVYECKAKATSKDEFIEMMNDKGYEVNWEDNRKYITFVDVNRELHGEKKCKVRNKKLDEHYNLGLGKDELLHGFEINRERETSERAEIERAEAVISSARADIDSSRASIDDTRASERASAEVRDDKLIERANRDVLRERQNLERQRGTSQRDFQDRSFNGAHEERSIDYGRSR